MKTGLGTCGLRGAYPACTRSRNRRSGLGFLVPGEARGDEIPASRSPFLPFPRGWCGTAGQPPRTRRPSATGVRVEGQEGLESAERKEPRRPGPCRISPPPLRILSRPRAPPGPRGGNATRYSFLPRTLQTSGSGQRSSAAAGERGRTALVWQINTRGPRPPRCPPPAARAARARHAIPAVATPGRRRICAPGPGPAGPRLRTHRLRRVRLGSGSRLGSAAARGCVRRKVRTVRAGGVRLAKSARGTGSVAHRPRVRVSQRPRERLIGAGVGGGCCDTLPLPRPPPPSGGAESHSQPERHRDTKTSCQPQTQVST